jgi:hypothetical protein
MSKHNTEKPKDGKNVEERDFLRYSFSSGQPSINGMTNFRLKTQEGQSFSFHSGTGIGGDQTGSGTGRAILSTPGLYEENLGDGLAFRSSPINYILPAKQINCRKGDIVLDAENGDIILRGQNIRFNAVGGKQDGVLTIEAKRSIDVDTAALRVQSENATVFVKSGDLNVFVKNKCQFEYNIFVASAFSEKSFGVLSKQFQSLNIRSL